MKFFIIFIILLIIFSIGCIQENNSGQASSAGAMKGEEIYLSNCVSCHGLEGKGDGPMASNLPEPPKDLTVVKSRSNVELIDTINNGEDATGMPAFEGALTEVEIQNVVEYIKTL